MTDVMLVSAGPATLEVLADGEGPLLVLAPSAGRGSDDLGAVTAELVDRGLRVLRPQPRGIGRSRGPMTGLTYVDWAADLAAVIANEGRGPAVLIGHAGGGRYCRVCAARFPDLVRGVVIAAAASHPPAERLGRDLVLAAEASQPVEARLDALRRSFFAPGHDPTGWLEGWSSATLAAQHASTPVPQWHTAGNVALLDLIAGQDAWRTRSTWRELADSLGPRVSVTVVADAGHALLPEQPSAVADAVADWLAKKFL